MGFEELLGVNPWTALFVLLNTLAVSLTASFIATACNALLAASGAYVAPFVLLLSLACGALVLNLCIRLISLAVNDYVIGGGNKLAWELCNGLGFGVRFRLTGIGLRRVATGKRKRGNNCQHQANKANEGFCFHKNTPS